LPTRLAPFALGGPESPTPNAAATALYQCMEYRCTGNALDVKWYPETYEGCTKVRPLRPGLHVLI